MLSFLLQSEGIELLLPQSLDLPLVLDFLHPSFLLCHLLKLVLLSKFLNHKASELLFHQQFFLLLALLSLFCLFFSHLHLNLLLFSLLGLLTLLTSGLIFKLFLVVLSTQVLELIGISSPFLFLELELLEDFILCDLFLLFGKLDCLLTRIQLLNIGHVPLLLLTGNLRLLTSLFLFEFKSN